MNLLFSIISFLFNHNAIDSIKHYTIIFELQFCIKNKINSKNKVCEYFGFGLQQIRFKLDLNIH